jgi:hypothetical protein
MTSIVPIDRRRRRCLRPAASRHDDAPRAERAQTASRKGFVAAMLKAIRLACALTIILAIEIGDSMSAKIGRIR